MKMINYGEKTAIESSCWGKNWKPVQFPFGMDAKFEVLVDHNGQTIQEYFSDYRQLGLPQISSEYQMIQDLVPEKIYKGDRTGESLMENLIIFKISNDQWWCLSTYENSLGTKFQKEMINYLGSEQVNKYNTHLEELKESYVNRTLGDIIKYSTNSLLATRSSYLSLNRQVAGFYVSEQSDDRDVLFVKFGNSERLTTFPLKKSNLSNENRRMLIDTKAKSNLFWRLVSAC
ncbi:hypothetical protein MHB77_31495 [Paenibacillus sp. FSL K6-3166]|uniref:hypothetical protein n=1 Tax=Paenibacillus sp. FSL K6-3166 TaxID=2921492 RepID=UPI0030F5505B